MSKRDAALIAPLFALHFAPVPLSHTAYERPIGAPVARRPNFPLFDKGAAAFGHRRRTLSPGSNVEYRSEEHTSELQSLMRISYAVFCLKKKKKTKKITEIKEIKNTLKRQTINYTC